MVGQELFLYLEVELRGSEALKYSLYGHSTPEISPQPTTINSADTIS